MARIKKKIICPCGHHLGVSDNSNCGGTKWCDACKKQIKYSIKNDVVSTSIK